MFLALASFPQSANASSYSNTLLNLWFEELSGNILDQTPNGYNFSVSGNPAYQAAGIIGNSIDFDGTGDYLSNVSFWNQSDLQQLTDGNGTLELSFMFDVSSGTQGIFYMSNASVASQTGDFLLEVNRQGTIIRTYCSDGIDQVAGYVDYTSPGASVWVNQTVVFNSSGCFVYKNGSYMGMTAERPWFNRTSYIYVGLYPASSGFNGKIDEVKLSNIRREPNQYQRYSASGNTAPSITLNIPLDMSWNNSENIYHFYTPTDDSGFLNCSLWTNVSGSWAYDSSNSSIIQNAVANSIYKFGPGSWPTSGAFKWAVRCYDNGVPSLDSFSSNYTFQIDTTAPVCTLHSPSNGVILSKPPYFNGTVTESNLASIKTNSTYFTGLDTTSPFNFTNTSYLPDGTYTINVSANDSATNFCWKNSTFTLDMTTPVLNITSPLNQSLSGSSVWFNVTGNEALSWVVYSLDGAANVSMTNSSGNWNALNSSMANGAHNVKFYANDTLGNMNVSVPVRYFNISSSVSCGAVSSSIILTGNLSSTGTCFNVNASNIIIDGAGYWVNLSASSGYCVSAVSRSNVTVRNLGCVANYGGLSGGVNYWLVRNSSIFNSSFVMRNNTRSVWLNSSDNINVSQISVTNNARDEFDWYFRGILFDNTTNSRVEFSNIYVNSSGAYGITVAESQGPNFFIGNLVNTFGSTAVLLSGSDNNLFINGSYIADYLTGASTYKFQNAAGQNNTFVSTNFSEFTEFSFVDALGGFVYRNDTLTSIYMNTTMVDSWSLFRRTHGFWNSENFSWIDLPVDYVTVRYTFSGFNSSVGYHVQSSKFSTIPVFSDPSGRVSFTAALAAGVSTDINFTLADSSVISLNSPSEGVSLTSSAVDFVYTPSNQWPWQNCSLYSAVSGSSYYPLMSNQSMVQNGTLNMFSYAFSSSGTYNWYVSCYTDAGTLASSMPRSFIIASDAKIFGGGYGANAGFPGFPSSVQNSFGGRAVRSGVSWLEPAFIRLVNGLQSFVQYLIEIVRSRL